MIFVLLFLKHFQLIYFIWLPTDLEELSSNYSFDPLPSPHNNKLAVPQYGIAEIYCESPAGLPPPRSPWWEGPDGKIILSETSAFSQNPTSNTLMLYNVQSTQAGNYTCLSENLAGITRASLELVVTCKKSHFFFYKIEICNSQEGTFVQRVLAISFNLFLLKRRAG
jgi:hypothetical protein